MIKSCSSFFWTAFSSPAAIAASLFATKPGNMLSMKLPTPVAAFGKASVSHSATFPPSQAPPIKPRGERMIPPGTPANAAANADPTIVLPRPLIIRAPICVFKSSIVPSGSLEYFLISKPAKTPSIAAPIKGIFFKTPLNPFFPPPFIK